MKVVLEAGAMAGLLKATEGIGRRAVRVAAAADRRMAVRSMLSVVSISWEVWPSWGWQLGRLDVESKVQGME
jgi:hypothetical protein